MRERTSTIEDLWVEGEDVSSANPIMASSLYAAVLPLPAFGRCTVHFYYEAYVPPVTSGPPDAWCEACGGFVELRLLVLMRGDVRIPIEFNELTNGELESLEDLIYRSYVKFEEDESRGRFEYRNRGSE